MLSADSLAKGKSLPVMSHFFDKPRFITMRLINDSFIESLPLRYFDRLDESIPILDANPFCVNPSSSIMYLSRFIMSSLLSMRCRFVCNLPQLLVICQYCKGVFAIISRKKEVYASVVKKRQ